MHDPTPEPHIDVGTATFLVSVFRGTRRGSLRITLFDRFPIFLKTPAEFNSIRCHSPTILFRSRRDGWISATSLSGSQFSKLCLSSSS